MTDRPRHVYVMYIRTAPEKLWQAITDPDFTRRYFHDTDIASEWKPGDPVTYRMQDGRLAVDGEVIEADPPKRLSYSWHVLYDDDASKETPSRVTWEIEPLGDVCKLTLVHEDFPEGSVVYEGVGQGWPGILSSLKTLLETGEPLAYLPG